MSDPTVLVAAAASAVLAAGLVRWLVPPTPRLAPRVLPYAGAAASAGALAEPAPGPNSGVLGALLGPPLARLSARLATGVDEAALARRLRHAGLFAELPPAARVQAYRLRQAGAGLAWGAGLTAAAMAGGADAAAVLLAAALGVIVGVARVRGRLSRGVQERRLQARIELYTVNQLLALHVRTGGGVVQALSRLVARGQGVVVGELAEVLRAHRGGRGLAHALEHAARESVEPHAARTYRLLARGAEYGADLASGLRALSGDLRQERIEALRRAATRRRAGALVPIIALLAPVMLLFVAAPLPAIVLGGW